MTWRTVMAVAGGAVTGLLPAAVGSAHTETNVVAVPAGGAAAVAFRPTHGCGDSPTIGVRVQAPVADARAGAVDGWTATATPDDAGHTVLEWTGGVLPADEAGAFPVELTVPDAVGTLLAFPAIQRCENGEELAWIGTAPGDERPAPQVLVLAAGSEPAATLDDVPLDAPGRALLVALTEGVVDDDAGAAPSPTAAPTTAAPTSTAPPPTEAPSASDTTVASAPPDGEAGGGSGGIIAGVVAAVVVGGGAAAFLARRRSSSTT